MIHPQKQLLVLSTRTSHSFWTNAGDSITWLADRQVKTLYIEPGSPWQNGHVESFHGSLRDECLDRELMLSLAEARVVIEDYRRHYNEERPHGGIGYRTPAQAFHEAQAGDAKELNTVPAA